MSKLIIIPDMHDRIEEPKHSACNDFMTWFINSEHNIVNSTLLFEGDLGEKPSPESDINDELHDFIERECKAEKKIILVGNHDLSIKGYQYKYLGSKFITIVDKPCSMKIGNLNCLLLPHYDYIQSEIKTPMYEYYSNLPDELRNQKYDFAFSHCMDESQVKIEKLYCDLSYLDITVRIFGHNHLFDKLSGGNYLGSVFENSSSEKNTEKYIAVIDTDIKEVEYVNIPKTLEHFSINYPDDLPNSKYKYNIFDINEVIDDKECIEYYTKQASIKGYTFWYNKLNKKQLKEISDVRSEKESSITDYFAEYCKENKVDSKVEAIVMEQLNNV